MHKYENREDFVKVKLETSQSTNAVSHWSLRSATQAYLGIYMKLGSLL